MSWPSFSAWVRDETIQHVTLVCPMRVLWRSYSAYCKEWGFEPAEASDFVKWLRAEEGVKLKVGGTGRLRRAALGIAIKQETVHARNA